MRQRIAEALGRPADELFAVERRRVLEPVSAES